MIIFLYGPDSYRRQQKLKEYIERYQSKYLALSLANLDFENKEDWDKFRDFSNSQSLFESSKLGVVSNIGVLENKEQKEFIKILKENLESKDLTLIINENQKLNKDYSFLLKEPVICYEFENLIDDDLVKFFQQEIKKRGLHLEKSAEDLLLRVYGGDSWGLVTELDKLTLFNEQKITKEVLDHHLSISLPINVYESLGRMERLGDVGSRLSILEELLCGNNDSAMIFNMFSFFIKNKSMNGKIADYDAAVKSGKLEYEEVLADLVLNL